MSTFSDHYMFEFPVRSTVQLSQTLNDVAFTFFMLLGFHEFFNDSLFFYDGKLQKQNLVKLLKYENSNVIL